jgi:hypothetical protein
MNYRLVGHPLLSLGRCGHLSVDPLVDLGEGLLTLQSISLKVLVEATSHDLGGGVRELNVALNFDLTISKFSSFIHFLFLKS